jgi:ABC-type multidrug transport system fused ATPase/permease subunit
VFEDGVVVEEGSYDQLVAMQGCFHRLEQGI